jgi:hypothetical protein
MSAAEALAWCDAALAEQVSHHRKEAAMIAILDTWTSSIVVWIAFSVAVGMYARNSNRDQVGWTLLALLISPVLAAAFAVARKSSYRLVFRAPTPIPNIAPKPTSINIVPSLAEINDLHRYHRSGVGGERLANGWVPPARPRWLWS